MKPSMRGRSLRNSSSSFWRGGQALKIVPVRKTQSDDFSRTNLPKSALTTELKVDQQSKESTTGFNGDVVQLMQQTSNSMSAAVEAVVARSQVKQLSRGKRFEEALWRMWSSQEPAAALANAAESFLTLLEPETRPLSADVGFQLVDNFAPVAEECPPTSGLEVTGTIPSCFNGVYVRNGSNPQFMPSGGYHLFDGDGMLHAVRIKDGIPSYCCRFTRTNRYLTEKAAGQPLHPFVMGELVGLVGFARLGLLALRDKLGIVDQSKGIGVANAGLAFYNGKLLAMSEEDMPYAIAISPDDGDLKTLGRYDISGTNQTASMTAHPKIDNITGEMFSYSYNVLEKPYLRYWRASPEGKMSPPVSINVKEPALIHDFAVTENYVIIPDPIMVFRLTEMLAGRSPVVLDEEKRARYGVLPKYATDDSAIKWFDTPGLSGFHYLNAWEEGEEVVVVGSTYTPPSKLFVDPTLLNCFVTEIRMNLKSGKTSRRRISKWNLDVGRVNENFYGRRTRFVYVCMDGPWPKFSGIVKLDLQAGATASAEVGVRKFPPGCYGSEPVFVPRIVGADDEEAEDDGYIVTFLHNENTNVSEMGIFDARSPTLEPVATVKLPARVPYGFHGIFLTEEQLASQKRSPL